MYNFSDTGSQQISIIFFILVVVLGAFFTMNLVLAIIVDAFNTYNDENQEEEEEKEEQEESEDEKSPEDKAKDKEVK